MEQLQDTLATNTAELEEARLEATEAVKKAEEACRAQAKTADKVEELSKGGGTSSTGGERHHHSSVDKKCVGQPSKLQGGGADQDGEYVRWSRALTNYLEAVHRGKGRRFLTWAAGASGRITEAMLYEEVKRMDLGLYTDDAIHSFDEDVFITVQSFIEGVIPSNVTAAMEEEGNQSGAELWRRLKHRLTVKGPIANHEIRKSLQTLDLPSDEAEIMAAIEAWELKIGRWQNRTGKVFDPETKYGTLFEALPKQHKDAIELDPGKYTSYDELRDLVDSRVERARQRKQVAKAKSARGADTRGSVDEMDWKEAWPQGDPWAEEEYDLNDVYGDLVEQDLTCDMAWLGKGSSKGKGKSGASCSSGGGKGKGSQQSSYGNPGYKGKGKGAQKGLQGILPTTLLSTLPLPTTFQGIRKRPRVEGLVE